MTSQVTIGELGHRGDGVADTSGGPLYVPYTLPSEVVTVEGVPGRPDRARLLAVDAASPQRVTPICPHFGLCGGCALQHWALPPQQDWKRQLVTDALERAGVTAAVAQTVDAHGAGRRRATFHARRGNNDTLEVGYAAPRAHHIVPIDRCPILSPSMAGAIEAAWAIAEALMPLKKPLDIQVTATDNGLDIDVRGSGPINAERAGALAQIATRRALARLTRHGEMIAQNAPPQIGVGHIKVTIPPGAFLQATAEGEAVLAKLVIAAAGTAKSIADLFCGIGPFALWLAQSARIAAADNDAAAIEALKRAAAATSGLKPIETLERDLFRQPLVASELKRFAAVVFDPPRQGAEAQVRELATSSVSVIVAVSCDATTFARDARILVDGGYRLEAVTPVDQFRYSPHVEIVGKFAR